MTPTLFTIARLPRLVFGPGVAEQTIAEAATLGRCPLLVTGARSVQARPLWHKLHEDIKAHGLTAAHAVVAGEPSPETVDDLVTRHRHDGIDVVVAIGGGSVLDAAKAVAGLLRTGTLVMDHLEGVGRGLDWPGPAVPMVAVPTTAGTGSEATRNAVLSRRGPDGFKKSFRHEDLVPRIALVDPDLLDSCPRPQLVGNAMDAFTQLLEAHVSTRANPFTDALAWSGLEAFVGGFAEGLAGAPEGRCALSYAAYLSGVVLAQTGLGAVHGLAAPLGAFFPAPHGEVCGTLLAEATAVNLDALAARAPDSPAVAKYDRVGRLLGAGDRHGLVAVLRDWQDRYALPRLGTWGVTPDDLPKIAAGARGNSMKTNPLVLNDDELMEILRRRL